MLRRLDFEVTFLRDVPLQEMEEAVNALNLRLRQGGMGLFYYADMEFKWTGRTILYPSTPGSRASRTYAIKRYLWAGSWGRWRMRTMGSISSFWMPVVICPSRGVALQSGWAGAAPQRVGC